MKKAKNSDRNNVVINCWESLLKVPNNLLLSMVVEELGAGGSLKFVIRDGGLVVVVSAGDK